MTGERQFNEADQARLDRFRDTLVALRAFLPSVECEAAQVALRKLIDALDELTDLQVIR